MLIDIITLFPEMFGGVFGESIIKRAVEKKILEVRLTQLRDFAFDKHRQVDDSPFGGGSGMVLKPEPMYRAFREVLRKSDENLSRRVIIPDPGGEVFTQDKAKELSKFDRLIFICGHYEVFDARIYDLADELISIGDYVLTGGELAACVVCDAVGRLKDGVLASSECHEKESIACGMLEYPQYTKPREYRGMTVPEVLLGGDHNKIERWRYSEALKTTQKKRPDLL